MFSILSNHIRRAAIGVAVLAPLMLRTAPAAGQTPPSAPSVQGVVFDSLRGVPLAGAFVSISGVGRATTSDARGRFRFDSLGPGTYTFSMQHDILDSIGVEGVTTRAVVRSAADEVTIAVPSFATLWARWCGGYVPRDSGLVHGTVRNAGGKPVAGATIEVTWTDLSVSGKSVQQRGKRGRVATDANGNFVACAIPENTGLQLRAIHDSATSGTIDLVLYDLPVSRRDLRVVARSEGVGVIAGMVTREGQPFSGARVDVEDHPEQRTGADGKFFFRDVVAGTRQVSILAVGMSPGGVTVDVPVGDTVLVNYDLQKIVALPGVKVSETSLRQHLLAEYDERKREGFGHYIDSSEISRYAGLAAAFSSMPGTIVRSRDGRPSGIFFQKGNGQCEATYLVDGLRAERDEVTELTPDKVAAIEVYERVALVPSSIGAKLPLRASCGVVVIWTKRLMP